MADNVLFAWIHISDIHTRHGDAARWHDQEMIMVELARDIPATLARVELTPDAILVTGDIAFSGDARKQPGGAPSHEYAHASKWLRTIASSVSLPKEALWLVPGNHDVARSTSGLDFLAITSLRNGASEIDTSLGDKDTRAILERRLSGYLELCLALNPACASIDGFCHRLAAKNGLGVRLVGLNTALLCNDDDDQGKLRVGMGQLRAVTFAEPEPPEHELVIVLSHHPLHGGWLHDESTVASWVGNHAHIHLSGHVHEAASWGGRRGGGRRQHIQVVAGAVHGDHLPSVPDSHGYNLAAVVHKQDGRLLLRVWPRRWSPPNARFVASTDCIDEGRPYAEHELGLSLAPAPSPPGTRHAPAMPAEARFIRADTNVDRRTPAAPLPVSEAELASYLHWARAAHSTVSMLGLGRGDVSVSLDDIYVPLCLAERYDGNLSGPIVRDLSAVPGSIELADVFRHAGERHLFILGDPGSGKTTALKKLHHALVGLGSGVRDLDAAILGLPGDMVPVFLRLRHFDGPLLRKSFAAYLQSELHSQAGSTLPPALVEGLGERLWQRGNLLLLLDGLDEIANAELRKEVCSYLETELAAARPRNIRAVVSSRFGGLGNAIDLDRSFLHLRVDTLSDEQIAHLVKRWFAAVGPQMGGFGRSGAMAAGDALLEQLKARENTTRRIKELVSNPLLLTLLCVVVCKGGDIPRRRVDFFRECLDTLLERWIHARTERPLFSRDQALALLRPIAWKLHTEARRDDLTRLELQRLLRPVLDSMVQDRPQPPFGEVFRWLTQTTGIMTEYSSGEHGFLHLHLQEYLAAQHAAYLGQEGLRELTSHFGEGWWQEVILLYVALSDADHGTPLLARVLQGEALLTQRELIRQCLREASTRSTRPLVRIAAGPTEEPERRAAALELLLEHVDRRVLQAAAAIMLEPAHDELGRLAERIESHRQLGRATTAPLDGSDAENAVLMVYGADMPAPAVAHMRESLERAGMQVYRDDPPGGMAAEEILGEVRAAVALVEPNARAPWESANARAQLSELAWRGRRIVLAYFGSGPLPKVPLFLSTQLWVRLPRGADADGIARIVQILQGDTADTLELEHWRESLPRTFAATRIEGLAPHESSYVDETTGMMMVRLDGGEFIMGDDNKRDDEKPAHQVRISPLWMAATTVTNQQYAQFIQATGYSEPSGWRDRRHNDDEQPIITVSWFDAVNYCNYVSKQSGLQACYQIRGDDVQWVRGADGYRLPTEAEWEYACRAGTQAAYCFGDDAELLAEYGWFRNNTKDTTQPVGRKMPNAWGLYDMHGNVWEWCWDAYGRYSAKAQMDPIGPEAIQAGYVLADRSMARVLRGGCFFDWPGYLRCATRDRNRPAELFRGIGFRCARGPRRQD